LNHSNSGPDFDYSYSDPDLSLTKPGEYSYFFSLVDYEEVISDTFEFFVDPCSITTFLNDEHDSNVEVNGFLVSISMITDYWSDHILYDDPYLCTKVFHLFDSSGSEVTDYDYTEPYLTVIFSDTFTYYFSLDDYPDT
jgi:hypothetical protein